MKPIEKPAAFFDLLNRIQKANPGISFALAYSHAMKYAAVDTGITLKASPDNLETLKKLQKC
jgi:hypothetical protein